VTLPLALRGHAVTALDAAPGQLSRLRVAAGIAGEADSASGGAGANGITPVVGDMRRLDALVPRDTFHVAIAPFRSLLHVADVARDVFTQVARALVPGGLLAFDVFHPDPLGVQEQHDRWTLRRRFERADGAWSVWERARFAEGGEGLVLDVRCERRDPNADMGEPLECRESTMRLATPHPQHWQSALEAADFTVESVFGWFDQRPLEPGDEDSIWLARAPLR
jgi:SAM-dependent methyltransferase